MLAGRGLAVGWPARRCRLSFDEHYLPAKINHGNNSGNCSFGPAAPSPWGSQSSDAAEARDKVAYLLLRVSDIRGQPELEDSDKIALLNDWRLSSRLGPGAEALSKRLKEAEEDTRRPLVARNAGGSRGAGSGWPGLRRAILVRRVRIKCRNGALARGRGSVSKPRPTLTAYMQRVVRGAWAICSPNCSRSASRASEPVRIG